MTTYNSYADIPFDVFAETILKLAADNIQATLTLTGIWEIISEEYNNEALELLIAGYPAR